MKSDTEIIRTNIQLFLEKKNLSATKLEKLAGIRSGTVRNIIYGLSKNPTYDTLSKLAQAMEISIDELVSFNKKTHTLPELPQDQLKELLLLFEIIGFLFKENGKKLSVSELLELSKKIYIFCASYKEYRFDRDFAQHELKALLQEKGERVWSTDNG